MTDSAIFRRILETKSQSARRSKAPMLCLGSRIVSPHLGKIQYESLAGMLEYTPARSRLLIGIDQRKARCLRLLTQLCDFRRHLADEAVDWEIFSKDAEITQGRNIADACKAAGVSHFIWSSAAHAGKGKMCFTFHADLSLISEQ